MAINIPKEEYQLLAKGVKYPDNAEWYEEQNDAILRKVIKTWKGATSAQRKSWKEGGEKFYRYINPGLSDDGWDYIKPSYSYVPMDSVLKTPSKYFGPTIKREIMKALWIEKGVERVADNMSWEIHKEWDQLVTGDIKKDYENGFVSKQFAKVMRPFKNDDEAWEALEVFYSSGNSNN